MNNWPVVPLRELLIEVKHRYVLEVSGYPVLSVTNAHGFVLSNELFGHQIHSRDLRNYKIVKKGQFAYNPSRLNVGSIAMLAEFDRGLVSPMYVVFETRDDMLDATYLQHWLASNDAQNQIKSSTQGSVRDSVSFEALSNLNIPLPPLPEQRRIAEILGSVDTLISKSSKVVEVLSRTYPLLLDNIFTAIPQRRPLAELLSEPLKNGYSAISSQDESGLEVLTLSALTPFGLDKSQTKTVPDICEVRQSNLVPGDILISRSNTRQRVGFVGLYTGKPEPCFYPDLMIRMRLKQDILPEYAEMALQSPSIRNRIQEQASGTSASMVKINRQILHRLMIPVTTLESQRQIVNQVSVIKQRLEVEQEYIVMLQKIKNALLRRLLVPSEAERHAI